MSELLYQLRVFKQKYSTKRLVGVRVIVPPLLLLGAPPVLLSKSYIRAVSELVHDES